MGRVVNRLLGPLYVDLNRNPASSVFLAGSGRSGTTWVSEIINYRDEYRYVFEPFHPEKVGICRDFRYRQYLRPEDRREEFLQPARVILSGGLRSLWTDRFHRRFVARRRLIKDIRANLLLGWMRANFPAMPMILLLRHPCAVVNSRLKLGWRADLGQLLEQENLMEDFLGPFEGEMRGAKTDFERHVLLWCAENYVPLKQLKRGEVHVACYEGLCENPKEEIDSLFAFLGKDFDEDVLRVVGRPSPLSRAGSSVVLGTPPVDGWKRHVTARQAGRTAEILSLFGLDGIYDGEDPMPKPGGALALMGG